MNKLSNSDQLRLIIREMLLSEKVARAGEKFGGGTDYARDTGLTGDGPGGDPVDVVSASGDAAANAEAQFAKWGGKKEPPKKNPESHPMFNVLIDMWADLWIDKKGEKKAKKKALNYINKGRPWSAAFISWAHKNDPTFKKSASHLTYMRAAKKARKADAKTGYVAYKPEELEDGPQRNDIVCKPRGTGDGWASIGRANHCDIYVGNGEMIGGNLGDTSKKVKYNPKNASMIIKKLAEAIDDEHDEAKIRDAIESVLLEEQKRK